MHARALSPETLQRHERGGRRNTSEKHSFDVDRSFGDTLQSILRREGKTMSWFETEWAGVAQVFRLRRDVKDGDKEREELVYGVTDLPRKQANASRLLAFQQAHWRIENRLHYQRDVSLGEDACQLRMSGAPQALAASIEGGLALPGLAPRGQCGFPDAAFLCASSGSLAVTVWQAYGGVRVNQKALHFPSSPLSMPKF